MTVTIPIRTVNTLNRREHHFARASRVKKEKRTTAWMLASIDRPDLPCTVTMTRIAPQNRMDSDGIVSGMKAIRDAIAEWLGVDDSQASPITWVVTPYSEKGQKGEYAVRVEFSPVDS